MAGVEAIGQAIFDSNGRLDILINNASMFRATDTFTKDGLDIRFAVNTFVPYILTQRMVSLLRPEERLVNRSSAAQSPVDLEALAGRTRVSDQLNAYARSKTALAMWSRVMAHSLKDIGHM